MSDIQNRKDIEKLVDAFYRQVLSDPVIGHFFTEVVQLQLDKHMPIMYSFWESALFGTGNYSGNPMTKHINLNQRSEMKPEHFERWVSLWECTVSNLFEGVKADLAKTRARNIAAIMSHKVSEN